MNGSRRRLVLGGLLVLLVVAAFLLARLARKPTCEGKTAAQWFQQFLAAQGNYRKAFHTKGETVYTIDVSAWSRDPAAQALCVLGPDAARYLANEIRRGDPIWAPTYWKLVSKVPPQIRRIVPSAPAPSDLTRRHAALALRALGTNAAAAAPILVASLKDCDSLVLPDVAAALRDLPFDLEKVDGAMEARERSGQITNALQIVEELSVRTPTAARILAKALSSADPVMRRRAAYTLEHIGPAAVVALPVLRATLTDEDAELRYTAACALDNLGTNARPAFPELIRATNDASIMVRRAAARALQKINRDPAATSSMSPDMPK